MQYNIIYLSFSVFGELCKNANIPIPMHTLLYLQ
jgi:hypothetical protein